MFSWFVLAEKEIPGNVMNERDIVNRSSSLQVLVLQALSVRGDLSSEFLLFFDNLMF
jgi:hypothetical protein